MRDGAKIGTFDAAGMNNQRLSFLMTGKEFRYKPQPMDTSANAVVLNVSGLTRAGEYQDVSLTVRAGEIVGLIGLLGSGRTELALSLFGMTRPGKGTIELYGKKIVFSSNRDAIRQGVAYVPEDRLNFGLVLDQSIAVNILASTLRSLAGPAGLIGTDAGAMPPRPGSATLPSRCPIPKMPREPCPAAISSVSCLPSGWLAVRSY